MSGPQRPGKPRPLPAMPPKPDARAEQHAETPWSEAPDHTEPRTGYRPELDDRTPRYGEYGMVRGPQPGGFAHDGRPGDLRDPRGPRDHHPDAGQPPPMHGSYTVESPGEHGDGGAVMHAYRDRWADADRRFAPLSRGDGDRHSDHEHGGPLKRSEPQRHSGQGAAAALQPHRDPHYQQWREEQVRQLDADYEAWHAERYEKFAEDFNQWRTHRASRLNRDLSPAEKDSAAPTAPGNSLPPAAKRRKKM